jgi:hypothetical protein
MPEMTHHAQTRLQQRGIPACVVESLLDVGQQVHDHRGATILFFDHRARAQLRRQVPGAFYKRIEGHLDAYAVLSTDGAIVTVGHRTQRIHRH